MTFLSVDLWVKGRAWLLSIAVAPARSQPIPATPNSVSAEQIETGRKAAERDATLDENQKQRTLELYDHAAQWYQQGTEAKAELARLETLIRNAPKRIKALRTGNGHPLREMADLSPVLKTGKAEPIELAVTQEQLMLQRAREAQKKQSEELDRLLVGSKGLSEEILKREKILEQIGSDLQAPVTDDTAALAAARKLVLESRRQLRRTEMALFKLRLENHDLLTNLAQTERDQLSGEIADRQLRLDTLSQAAQKLREKQARRAREEAEVLKSKTEALPHPLQAIAEENAHYHQELEALVNKEQSVAATLRATQLELHEIKTDFDRARQRVEVVGNSEAIGRMLKRRRMELPSLQSYSLTSAERREEIGRVTDRQIEIDELLRARGNVRGVVAETLDALAKAEHAQFEQRSTALASARRDALNELQKVYGRYIGQITALDLAERQLVKVAETYINYIDDRLIWIPGAGIGALLDPAQLGDSLIWILALNHWREALRDTWKATLEQPLLPLLTIIGILLLLKNRQASLERLKSIGRETRMIRTDSFKLTLEALGHILVITTPWPLFLIGYGWLLSLSATTSPYSLALANGLIKAGSVLACFQFLIWICRPDGIGERHLRWPQPVCKAIARELSRLLPVAIPLVYLTTAAKSDEPLQSGLPLERLAFITLMILITLFFYRLLRSGGALIKTLRKRHERSALLQLHFLWFPLLVVTPLLFAAISAAGYHNTALHLEQRLALTFAFFVGLFLFKELLLRSLYIAERRLRYEDALRRREEQLAQRAQHEAGKEEPLPIPLEIPEVNFDQLSEQNKRLLRAGFIFSIVIGIWSIWSNLLPALGFLNSTELPFHASRIVDGITKEVPVTLGDLILGFITLVITVLAAKNIPGVLEIALLQRLPLEHGARYAITSLSQYLIAGIGLFMAFGSLGLQWSSIQWLVAALGVGLGFGLQEIVANFISGIILLFERPIRVGDVVTLDTTSGVVSRIRIRATTITNWDKQELLIPNKEFITGRVINWTLSDRTNRILVTVGVAYGTDVARALALMLEAARENEDVIEDPKPVVTFEGFGDNALTLVLRSYLGAIENRLPTITALHQAVYDKFNAAGIEIAFPQRDIHVSAPEPLDIRLHRPPRNPNPPS